MIQHSGTSAGHARTIQLKVSGGGLVKVGRRQGRGECWLDDSLIGHGKGMWRPDYCGIQRMPAKCGCSSNARWQDVQRLPLPPVQTAVLISQKAPQSSIYFPHYNASSAPALKAGAKRK